MKKVFGISFIALFSIYAQTFNVSNTSEFRKALQDAATNGENDTIILAPGIYKTTDDEAGTFKYYSLEENNLTIIGSDNNKTILSGDNKEQILNFSPKKKSWLILKNLTFINAYNKGNGGAVYDNYKIIVIDCNFSNNEAYQGGGIYSKYSIIIKNSFFSNNKAMTGANLQNTGKGGGFYSGGNIEVSDSTFDKNKAREGGGFYYYSQYNKSIHTEVVNSKFFNNTAPYGGGGFSSKNVTVNNSVFIDNEANKGSGGGFTSSSKAIVKNSIFKGNIANNGGGFSSSYGGALVENSKFIENKAEYGGGFNPLYDKPIVKNSIFIKNQAKSGGGFYSFSKSGTVINSIFTYNKAEYGGGFVSNKDILLINSLFAFNSDGIYLKGQNNKIYNNIFIDNNLSDIRGNSETAIPYLYNNYIDLSKLNKASFNFIPKNNIFKDINLGFKDLGQENYELTASSDLIDKGTTEGIEDLIPKTDLAGNPRIVGKTIDIGPYEYQGDNKDVETNTTISNETDIKVNVGWNMINIPTDIENLSSIDAISIWKWNNEYKTWETYSKDPNLKDKFSLYYKLIDTLKSGDGVWVNEDREKILKFKNPKYTEINWLTLNRGWNLKGNGENISLDKIPSKIKMIWYWDNLNKKWMVYSTDKNINNLLQVYYDKGTFEKLNKLEVNKAYWFFVN